MTTTRIVLPGRPTPYARVRGDNEGHFYTPAEYRTWKDAAAGRINLTRRGVQYSDPIHMEVYVYGSGIVAAITDSVPDVRPRGVQGDLDNYVKAVLDAAQDGHLIANDRQVQRVTAYFIRDEPFPA